MIKILFPDQEEWECPINIGDIVLAEVDRGSDRESVDHIGEFEVSWDEKNGARITGLYGHNDHSFRDLVKFKEVLRRGDSPLNLSIDHSINLSGRAVLIRDAKEIHLTKITGMNVYFRDYKDAPFTRCYTTEKGWEVELDGEEKTEHLILPKNASEQVEKWMKWSTPSST